MKFPKYKERGAYHFKLYEDGVDWYVKCVDAAVEFCQGSTLDLGCGEGFVLSLINKKYYARGIDNNPEAIKLGLSIRGENSHIDTYCEDIEITELEVKFEYLSCINVIEHLERPERIIEIFAESITKAGIIITDKPGKTLGKHHVHEFTKQELLDLFKGYQIEYFEPHPDFHGVKVYK